MREFDAGNGGRGSSKVLEAEHRSEPQLDRSVILLDQIVDVLGRPDLALISRGMFAESLLGRAMRSLIAVEGVVTPTWIGAARGLEGALPSGRGGGSPRPERFVS